MKGYTKPLILISLVLILDQAFKTWVKTTMVLGQEYKILGNWFIIHFTENNGMAFGMEFGGESGKIALSLFRIVAVAGIGYGLHYLIKKKYHRDFILNVALIFAGAVGNIIDSIFYGKIYGYAGFLYGRVVDMLYFPLIDTTLPDWVPYWGGENFVFFQPVFNLADASISIGVILILIFQKRYFKEDMREETGPNNEVMEE